MRSDLTPSTGSRTKIDNYLHGIEFFGLREENRVTFVQGQKLEGRTGSIGWGSPRFGRLRGLRAGTDANASSKRIASANETALRNIQLGLLAINLLAFALRLLFALITSRSFVPSKRVIAIHLFSLGATIAVWRWFVLIGTPRKVGGNIKAGEDLGGKGVIELAWDLSAILGDWIWWFYLLIPGFGAYKAFNTVRPILGMLVPSLFGPRAPKNANEAAAQEQGDKRVQQMQKR
ncbi:MAG: hypothetical protein TREMPRED_000336 [Tremellales sp. Tagirdzhanova-0007]|nr:MAG: hypothetical protein TREMPRED_000336 [Tremellales sp. Tagirdzhanova-0007]